MRIPCPYCGERSVDEFTALGDATVSRPEGSGDTGVWIDYVYFRDNPAGRHHELFYHHGGCRAWLVVERDTRTHGILSVMPNREAAARRAQKPPQTGKNP